jgi:hypothetical protein
MYQKFPSHPAWPQGENYFIEPALGGPLTIKIEHDGLSGPSYLEPSLAGFSTGAKVIGSVVVFGLLALAASKLT